MPRRSAKFKVAAVLVATLAGLLLALVGIWPQDLPVGRDPSFVDNIFASRAVILAIRIALVFLAAYVVISVVGLVANRQWLEQLGPVKVADSLGELEKAVERLAREIEAIDRMEQRLEGGDDALTAARSGVGARTVATIVDQDAES